ncbi:MAG: chemotaxis protein CheX [Opitutales bacterium]
MAVTQLITETVIQDSIIRAVDNVCRTMLQQEARFLERTAEPTRLDAQTVAHVFGSVGFVGATNGLVYLCLPDDFALFAASHILGMSPSEIEFQGPETLKDVVGEITNITVGGFKNALCDIGYPCKLTLPTIVRGNNLSVANIKGAHRHVCHFDCHGHRIIADIQIKPE